MLTPVVGAASAVGDGTRWRARSESTTIRREMPAPSQALQLYLNWRSVLEDPFVELDLSHSGLTDQDLQQRESALGAALDAMAKLEAGGIANPDEQRRVGHYWLRAPGLAPEPALEDAIVKALHE